MIVNVDKSTLIFSNVRPFNDLKKKEPGTWIHAALLKGGV